MKKIWRSTQIRTGLTILIVGLLCTGLFMFILSLFSIDHIEVDPATVSIKVDSTQLPTTLLFFPSARMRTFILKEYPRLKDVEFIKQYPHTLKIHLTMRTMTAVILANSMKFGIDDEGVLFRGEDREDLPLLELPVDNPNEGDKVRGQGINTSLAFIKKLSHDEPIQRIVLSTDRTLQVQLKDVSVLLLADADGEKEADTLQTLLKGFRMKGSLPSVIDLRFAKPIITP